jgi:hypothetical protein
MISLALFLIGFVIVATFVMLFVGLFGRLIMIALAFLLGVWFVRSHPAMLPVLYILGAGIAALALVPQRIVDEWAAKVYRAFR